MSRHRISRALAAAVAAGAVLALAATAGAAVPARADTGARAGERQDPRTTPDQRDRAEGRRIVASTPVKVVELRQVPTAGFDVADAAIGAGGMLGVVLLAAGGAKLVVRRRREPGDLVTA